jgi:UDPglucose 6-dehydrogenase
MNVGILGAGIVGLATAKGFEKAHKLFIYDKYKEGFLSLKEVAQNSEVIFLTVPTPMKKSGEIDLSAIYQSVEELNEYIFPESDTIIVIRSTAVSGSTDKLAEAYPRLNFAVNPEFLREVSSEEDFIKSERIIIGVNKDWIFEKVKKVYIEAGFTCPIIKTNFKTAAFVKYVSNCFLATKCSFANEMYEICSVLGIDYNEVIKLLVYDHRIGTSHWQVPGPDGDFGWGGKCFPKDLNALMYLAREHHVRPYLLEEVWRTNLKYRKNKDWEK